MKNPHIMKLFCWIYHSVIHYSVFPFLLFSIKCSHLLVSLPSCLFHHIFPHRPQHLPVSSEWSVKCLSIEIAVRHLSIHFGFQSCCLCRYSPTLSLPSENWEWTFCQVQILRSCQGQWLWLPDDHQEASVWDRKHNTPEYLNSVYPRSNSLLCGFFSRGIFFVTKGTFGQLTCEWQYLFEEFTKEPMIVESRRLRIEAKVRVIFD